MKRCGKIPNAGRSAPDDPIAAAEGALAEDFGELDLARLRREAREDERIAEARRGR